MQTYANLNGKSGIKKYSITPTAVKIKFIKNSGVYVYNYDKPGKGHVERIKTLALAGKGLSKYINQSIKRNYYSVE